MVELRKYYAGKELFVLFTLSFLGILIEFESKITGHVFNKMHHHHISYWPGRGYTFYVIFLLKLKKIH